ncbi:MAG TPA: cupin domain-containing protein [Gemmatimonadaceae bacterium]|jgi:quercetin dioxygenase-like cupin family protein
MTTLSVSRRTALETLAMAGAAVLLAPMLASAEAAPSAGPIFTQELPPVSLEGWNMTALEITYAPGQVDRAHRHPGFVFGYVLEGDLRFKVDGGQETVYHAGQMFYEKPGSVHRVSANANASKPCRFLAMVFVDKTKPLTEPV